jgi:hypothetical protein
LSFAIFRLVFGFATVAPWTFHVMSASDLHGFIRALPETTLLAASSPAAASAPGWRWDSTC